MKEHSTFQEHHASISDFCIAQSQPLQPDYKPASSQLHDPVQLYKLELTSCSP